MVQTPHFSSKWLNTSCLNKKCNNSVTISCSQENLYPRTDTEIRVSNSSERSRSQKHIIRKKHPPVESGSGLRAAPCVSWEEISGTGGHYLATPLVTFSSGLPHKATHSFIHSFSVSWVPSVCQGFNSKQNADLLSRNSSATQGAGQINMQCDDSLVVIVEISVRRRSQGEVSGSFEWSLKFLKWRTWRTMASCLPEQRGPESHQETSVVSK